MKRYFYILLLCAAAALAIIYYQHRPQGTGTPPIMNDAERSALIAQGTKAGYAMDGSKKDFLLLLHDYPVCAKKLTTERLSEKLHKYLDGFLELYKEYKAGC
jgi:hypothetical protein